MPRRDLTHFVTTRLAEGCRRPIERLRPETPLLELDLDSLTLVAILTQVEAAYNVELTADDLIGALDAHTLASLIDTLAAVLARGAVHDPVYTSRVNPTNEA